MALHPVHGHEEQRVALARAHRERTLPSALLFHGPRGVGKQRLGLWLGQLLLCETPTPEGPCGACTSCRLALRLEHPDLHWYFPLPRPKRASSPDKLAEALEEARWEALSERRESPLLASPSGGEPTGLYLAAVQNLRRQARRSPSTAAVQLFLIGSAEEMIPQESSPEAANALLKLLEEPPERTVFLLTSSEPGRLLSTIRSRAQSLYLPPLSVEATADFLVDRAGATREDAHRAARLADGSIGRALGFLPDGSEPGALERTRREAFELLRAAVVGAEGDAFAQGLRYGVAGARGLQELFDAVGRWLRDLAAVASGAAGETRNVDASGHLAQMVEREGIHPTAPARALGAVEEAKILAAGNVNPQLIIHGLVHDLRVALRPAREGA